jgi:hypothetical protein
MRLARLGAFAVALSALWWVTNRAYQWMEALPLPSSAPAIRRHA